MRTFPAIRVKICSITNRDDALLAARLGADAIGLIFAESKRRITAEQARDIIRELPQFVTTVGVFMDQPLDFVRETLSVANVHAVQLHGDEPPEYCAAIDRRVIKRIPVKSSDTPDFIRERMIPYHDVDFLLDPGAGDGQIFNWRVTKGLGLPFILAGGLNPDNVWAAIRMAGPVAVDVSSGVEASIGRKDPDKLKAFIQEVKL